MEFRVLGPLQVSSERGELPVGGRQRAVLALLLIEGDAGLSADRLIDELWGERPPRSAANMIQGSVSRLRKLVDGNASVVSRPFGYALAVPAEQVDARRFEALVREGERLLREGSVAAAAEMFRAGLSLWRGRAFEDVPRTPAVAAETDRLDELRLVATELRIDAELATGRDGTIVPELEALVGTNPFRERLRANLMLALYRAGRQTEALEVYRDGRRRFVDELGLEPGPRLQQLERAILAHDPSLDVPHSPALPVPWA